MLERARRRAMETGRHVPVEEIKDSLVRVPQTVVKLKSKSDFVAHIEVRGYEFQARFACLDNNRRVVKGCCRSRSPTAGL